MTDTPKNVPLLSGDEIAAIASNYVAAFEFPDEMPEMYRFRIKEAATQGVVEMAPFVAEFMRVKVLNEVAAALSDVDLNAQMIVLGMLESTTH